MAKICCVPNCTTDTSLGSQNIILYKVPANKEMRCLWIKAIGHKDQPIKCTDYVCSKHFKKDEFMTNFKTGKVKNKYNLSELSEKAIPSIFPTTNTHTSIQPTSDAESFNLQRTLSPNVELMYPNIDKSPLSTLESDQNSSKTQNRRNPPRKVHKLLSTLGENIKKSRSKRKQTEDSLYVDKDETSDDESESSESYMDDSEDLEEKIEQNVVNKPLLDTPLFKRLWDGGESEILLPSPNWGLHCMPQSEKLIVISEMEMVNRLPKVYHQMTVSESLKLSYFIRAKRVEMEVVEEFHLKSGVSCMSDIENALTEFAAVKICNGGPSEAEFSKSEIATHLATVDEHTHLWVHRNCSILTRNDEQCCKSCATLEQYFCKVTTRPFIYR